MPARQGERHHLAKLTADDVRSIRQRRAGGETIDLIWLSSYPDMDPSTLGSAARGDTWKHVEMPAAKSSRSCGGIGYE